MDRWRGALRLIGVGWYIAACIILGVMAGLWLDGKLSTKPWLMLLGLSLGLGCAFWGVYRMLFQVTKEEEDENKGR
jgi:F0F1-type ATP synthase assembly protein I